MTFITFGSDHLPDYNINPRGVMLLIEDRATLMADEELGIGGRFAFEYFTEADAEKMKAKYGMKLYTREELLELKHD